MSATLFAEFADKFDYQEAACCEEKGIKVLYCGVSKENPSKVVIMVLAEPGVIPTHMKENAARFISNGAMMDTAVVTAEQEC